MVFPVTVAYRCCPLKTPGIPLVRSHSVPKAFPRRSPWGPSEKEVATTGSAIATHSDGSAPRPSPAKPTPTASCGRSRSRSTGATGSTPVAPTCRWPCGPRSSCCSPAGWRRRPRRPTGATSTSTSCPASAPTARPLPADEIENWLNDEVGAGVAPSSVHRHYRTLRRMLEVAVEKQKHPHQPVRPGRPTPRPTTGR